MKIYLECKKKDGPAFIRKKSFSVSDFKESPNSGYDGVWSSFKNKAEQFFGLNESHTERDEDTSDVWEDAIDGDLNNVSILIHEMMEPPPPDSYCVAVYK